MATAMYLEQYLDSLETLPAELQRNFQLMRQLDERSEELKVEIDKLTVAYVEEAKKLPPDARVERIKKIQELYSKCREFADDKVTLAMQTYEMVDKHIRKLDSDLARFEADLKEKSVHDSGAPGTSKGDGDSGTTEKKRRKKGGRGTTSEDEAKSSKKKQKGGEQIVPVQLSYSSSDVLDMPVDPNEPTYCLCHQVSYGEMIGCDNPDCPIEWFHFGCVGLTSKPKGKWFCPKCREEREKKKR